MQRCKPAYGLCKSAKVDSRSAREGARGHGDMWARAGARQPALEAERLSPERLTSRWPSPVTWNVQREYRVLRFEYRGRGRRAKGAAEGDRMVGWGHATSAYFPVSGFPLSGRHGAGCG